MMIEHHDLSFEETRRIEREARALRAAALRDSVAALGRALARGWRGVLARLRRPRPA